uniref:EB domain-containing protein n=1 Tax=Syphacia muris TaxID=451379 RepID=A0A0N5ANQ9_9BILA
MIDQFREVEEMLETIALNKATDIFKKSMLTIGQQRCGLSCSSQHFENSVRLSATPNVGTLCMTVENFRAAKVSELFYECTPLSDAELREYSLKGKYLGVWNERNCPSNAGFDERQQKCIEKRKLRRQQAACSVNPASTGCSAECSASNAQPQVGNQCNWITATLMPDSSNSTNFLQCAPQSSGEVCGEWIQVPCTSDSVFDIKLQICVPRQLNQLGASACGADSAPVCSCASGGTEEVQQCPGDAKCVNVVNVCCQVIVAHIPMIMSSPLNADLVMHQPPMSCPDFSIPVAACSPTLGCPTGSMCNVQLGMCCSTQAQSFNVVLLCPNGAPAEQSCGYMNQCPTGYGCYEGACCPLACPSGQNPVGFCGQASASCPQSASCVAGCCCVQQQQQATVRLPVCPNGQTAIKPCRYDQDCGPQMECSSGGCCPMPFCPSGSQATGRCLLGSGCASFSVCIDGLCCPLPTCPNGNLATRVCMSSIECGSGMECANGGCCPLPICPNGQPSSQRCDGNCPCPAGQQCINGGCCLLPSCPGGLIAISICAPGYQCGSGMECANGGCCPLPMCPSGMQATQRCQGPNACPANLICENGVCCPSPVCPNGQIALQLCGFGNSCPIGYVCEGRGCCPEPMPLCPNGGRAMQKCERGSECAPGYGCTPLGGCCLLSMDPVCPAHQSPVCQCSPTNACPILSTCMMGTCCTNALTTYEQVPGTSCQSSSQCNGYANNCAQCIATICVCVNGAASNGATCQQIRPNVLRQARSGCDQYGSSCKFVLSTARRKPLFAPYGNVTEKPLWFNVAERRRCLTNSSLVNLDVDSTCLPNEKCINGECRMKLWPGEYGCESDEECLGRCNNTYCEKQKTDKNVSQCQCKDGMLLYGRCFTDCPEGFHESGAYCMHDDEEEFWKDAVAQENLKYLLNKDQC